MTSTRLSPADSALVALYLGGAAVRPAPTSATAETLAELKRLQLAARVHGGVALLPAGVARAPRLVARPDAPGAGR